MRLWPGFCNKCGLFSYFYRVGCTHASCGGTFIAQDLIQFSSELENEDLVMIAFAIAKYKSVVR